MTETVQSPHGGRIPGRSMDTPKGLYGRHLDTNRQPLTRLFIRKWLPNGPKLRLFRWNSQKMQCNYCEYEWTYSGSLDLATCPNCNAKTAVPTEEQEA